MKTILRILAILIAAPSSFYFVYFVAGTLEFASTTTPSTIIPKIIALTIAILISIFLWIKVGTNSDGFIAHVLKIGIIVGSIGFALGFFGPVILTPSANQGPLLGLFITGPGGFLLGLLGGVIHWIIRDVKRKKKT